MTALRGIVLSIIGDDRSAMAMFERQQVSTTTLGRSYKKLAVTSQEAAAAQVAAAVKATRAQEAQVASLRAVAASSPAGSRQQIAAAALAADAEARLARSQGMAVISTKQAAAAAKTAERDVGKMTRGVLAGSGVFGSFGRSLAFASGGFLAFSIGATVITRSIEGAEELQKAQRSLGVAIGHTGGNLRDLLPRYEEIAKAAARFGVTQAEATTGLARATVLTGDAASAQRAYQEALVISKATGKSFNTVLIATSKAQAGITTSLRRFGVLVGTTSTGAQQYAVIMKRFGGQARAATTDHEQLRAALANTEAVIGEALLPTVEKVMTAMASWLTRMNESGKLERDVSAGMTAIHDATAPLIGSLGLLADAIGEVNSAWNSLKTAQKRGGAAGLLAANVKTAFDVTKLGATTNLFPLQALASVFGRPSRPSPQVTAGPPAFFRNPLELGPRPTPGGPFGTAQPMTQFFKKFQLNFAEQLAQVQASLTRSTADDVAAARRVVARIRKLIEQGRLHGNALVQALGLEASALSTIWSAEDAAAQRRAQAAQAAKERAAAAFANLVDPLKVEVQLLRAEAAGKSALPALRALLRSARHALASAKTLEQQQQALQQIVSVQQQIKDAIQNGAKAFVVPMKLQIAVARDLAFGRDTTQDLLKIRRALLKALHSGKFRGQALLDLLNQIADINQQLGNSAKSQLAGFKQASTQALTAGLGLTAEQRKILRARLSQLGPGGTVPGSGVGAAGLIINPETGRPIIVHTHVNLDGKRVADSTTKHQQRHRRRNPRQRRGPNAGG